MEANAQRRWANVKVAARHAGLGVSTFNKYRVHGGGPLYHKPSGSRRVVYDLNEVDAWLAERSHTSTSEYGK